MKYLILTGVAALALSACGQTKQTVNAQNSSNTTTTTTTVTTPPAANMAAPAAGAAITPGEVRTMIERDGARATIATLNQGGSEASPNRLAMVMRGVAAGDQAWLDLVPMLRQGTDGETGEGLVMSISEALPRNATGVVRLISEDLDAQSLCSDLELGLTPDASRNYRQTSIAAVEAVNDPALQQSKAACLTALRALPAAA